jgi:hypothetical protein
MAFLGRLCSKLNGVLRKKGLYMFSRETSKNLTAAKCLEQRLVAAALHSVVEAHHMRDDSVSAAILGTPLSPKAHHIGTLLYLLREALSKEHTPFLRDLSLAIFMGAPLFKPLSMAVEWLPRPLSTLDLFEGTRKEAERYVAHSGQSLQYYLLHPRFVWSALMSTYLGSLVFGWLFPFDPKAFAWNTSGSLFNEKFHDRNGALLEVDWTAGPTPTVGDYLSPEASAAIEALGRKNSLCFQHTMWIYVNLQNVRGISERRRSQALFDASRQTPSKFRLASVSVDAPFYRNRDGRLTTLHEHRRHLLGELRRGLSPSPLSWYAFSLLDGEHEAWWQCVEDVVERAFSLAEMTQQHYQIVVFHELVVLGLVRAWQGFCCHKASGSVISTVACKECADRGGSVNAAFTWALSDGDEGKKALAVEAVLWGRPLLARQRLIERARTRGFEALVRSLLPSDVQSYLEQVWDGACQGRWWKRCSLWAR